MHLALIITGWQLRNARRNFSKQIDENASEFLRAAAATVTGSTAANFQICTR